eukprot:scaffold128_cov328-Pavlova_lutheri.AAC.5
MRSKNRNITRERTDTGVCDQLAKASLADATAASNSSHVLSGTRPRSSCVAGLRSSTCRVAIEVARRPSIQFDTVGAALDDVVAARDAWRRAKRVHCDARRFAMPRGTCRKRRNDSETDLELDGNEPPHGKPTSATTRLKNAPAQGSVEAFARANVHVRGGGKEEGHGTARRKGGERIKDLPRR